MNEVEVIDKKASLTRISDDLMSVINIENEEHHVMQIPFELIALVLPKAKDFVDELVTNKNLTPKLGEKMFVIANASDGDILKARKNDNYFWGAMKTSSGKSKMAVLKEVTPGPEAAKVAASSNPYILLILVAITIIEKDIKKILSIEKQILSFLETEKESEIEGDIKTLSSILNKYSANQDNEKFVTSNHKLALDIQRTARKNMIFYQKRVIDSLKDKKLVLSQYGLESIYRKFDKEFKYYKMSIFAFSLATFLEVLLSENYEESNLSIIRNEIKEAGENYTALHDECSKKMKDISHNSIETNTVKGTGLIVEFAGKLFSKSKNEKNLARGEKLQNKGNQIVNKSSELENKIINEFEETRDSQTQLFIEKVDEMVFIFNRANQIGLDNKNLYLVE